jgi:hypothetical protein
VDPWMAATDGETGVAADGHGRGLDPRGRWPSGPRQGAPRASGCVRRLGDGGRGSRAAGQGQGAARLGGGVFWWELGFYLGQFLWAFG